MITKRWTIIAIISWVIIALAVLAISAGMVQPVDAGQVIHFNGQTLDLSDASNVLIQSSNDMHVFDADEQGGVVTVTTSIVTVTVWMNHD